MGSEKKGKEMHSWLEAMRREEIDKDWENARHDRLRKENAEKLRREEEQKQREESLKKQHEIAEARAKAFHGAVKQSCSFGQSGFDMDSVTSHSVKIAITDKNDDEFGM